MGFGVKVKEERSYYGRRLWQVLAERGRLDVQSCRLSPAA